MHPTLTRVHNGSDAEIDHFDVRVAAPGAQQDVLRLDVAVYQVSTMAVLQHLQQRLHHPGCLDLGVPCALLEAVEEVTAFAEFHHKVDFLQDKVRGKTMRGETQ